MEENTITCPICSGDVLNPKVLYNNQAEERILCSNDFHVLTMTELGD